MKTLLAYVPALHRGYLELFERYRESGLYLLGDGFRQRFTSLERDVRAVSARTMQKVVHGLDIFHSIDVVEPDDWEWFVKHHSHVVAPDEDVMHELLDPLVGKLEVTYENWRLRWDKQGVLSVHPVVPSRVVSESAFCAEFMRMAEVEAAKSADFWRQVGAVAAKEGNILYRAYNEHKPNDRTLYANGDPRSNFNAGEFIEYSTALHAEAAITVAGGRPRLEGSDVYVTTFPCHGCARLLAHAGIARVFYREGYSRLDALEILGDAKVEIVHIAE